MMQTMIQTAAKLTADELKTAIQNMLNKAAELGDAYDMVFDAMLEALRNKLPEIEFCKFCDSI